MKWMINEVKFLFRWLFIQLCDIFDLQNKEKNMLINNFFCLDF